MGPAAIALLAIFRIGQGIALGGAWDGLPSLLALTAPPGKRGWYAMMGQLGAPIGFIIASALYLLLYGTLSREDFLDWGWRYPFFCAFAINVVALFARLRLVVTHEYDAASHRAGARAVPGRRIAALSQGVNVVLGAFGALASYALFHVVTVYPLALIVLFTKRVGHRIPRAADRRRVLRHRRHRRLRPHRRPAGTAQHGGHLCRRHCRLQRLRPDPAERRHAWGTPCSSCSGSPCWASPTGRWPARSPRTSSPRYRYTGAALTSDLAWLIGAGFAPLVALGLSAYFGLGYVSLYLLSGAVGTLAALWINRRLAEKE